MDPIFPSLLAPLRARTVVSLGDYDAGPHSPQFLSGLLRVLDRDVSDGAIDKVDPEWAETLLLGVRTPHHDPDNTSPIVRVDWPVPGEPWHVPEGADIRECLLARLVHLGLDPWAPRPSPKRGIGSSLASAYCATGYPNLMRQAMRLPQFATADMNQTGPGRRDHTPSHQTTILHDTIMLGHLDIAAKLLESGASTSGALHYAHSAEAVKMLLAAGASLDEKSNGNTPVQAWSTGPVEEARAMLAVVSDLMTPHQRFKNAMSSGSAKVLSDAIKQWPEWKEFQTTMNTDAGDLILRLPMIALLQGAGQWSTGPEVQNALRLLIACPPDERQVIPGISERLLARVQLRTIIANANYTSYTKSEKPAQDRLQKVMASLEEPSATIFSDMQALVLAGPSLVPRAHSIVSTAFRQGWWPALAKSDKGAEEDFSSRTVDDAIALGRLAHAMWPAKPSIASLLNETVYALVGTGLVGARSAAQWKPNDVRTQWWSRLTEANPDRIDEIGTACTQVVGLLCTLNYSSGGFSSSVNPWQRLMENIDEMIDQGAKIKLDQSHLDLIEGFAVAQGNPDAATWARSLPARVQAKLLEASTTQPSAERRSISRL